MSATLSRQQIYSLCPRILKHLPALGQPAAGSQLGAGLCHLVHLRVSQLNHCGFCQHLHAAEARHDGEQQARLDVLPAWREMHCFTQREKLALGWAEALTLLATQPIDDQLRSAVLEEFGEADTAELSMVILAMNSWNRLAVAFQFQPELHK